MSKAWVKKNKGNERHLYVDGGWAGMIWYGGCDDWIASTHMSGFPCIGCHENIKDAMTQMELLAEKAQVRQ